MSADLIIGLLVVAVLAVAGLLSEADAERRKYYGSYFGPQVSLRKWLTIRHRVTWFD